MNHERIAAILDTAREEGRSFLLETEGLALLDALEIPTPAHRYLTADENGRVRADDLRSLDLGVFSGDRIVLKVVSADIQHKSDMGGVSVVERSLSALRRALEEMAETLQHQAPGATLSGFLVAECIPFEKSLGHEMILGLRWNDDLGPVAVFGPGGIYTEFLSRSFREGMDVAVLSPFLTGTPERESIVRTLQEVAISSILGGGLRGQKQVVSIDAIADWVERFLDLAREFMPGRISEFEVNPFVVSPEPGRKDGTSANRLVALDILVRLSERAEDAIGSSSSDEPHTIVPGGGPQPRPLRKINALLHPKSIALAGVSETHKNPGRVILDNLVAGGFDPDRLYVIKPGCDEIGRVRCVPRPAELPERVDMAVLSVAAASLPEMVTEFIETERAESLIVIPGGLEEKQGSESIVARMHEVLRASRTTDWGGPVINGGNCLGIQSRPGNYDTLFIPRYKLPVPQGEAAPVALICQSGAHMVANLDRLGGVVPRYSISAGNQTDLTVGDYLTFLADDPEIRVFACYVEGFRPMDGLAFMRAAEKIVESGRTVLLYLASRTPSGAKASASHTASLAGDYPVLRAIAQQAGIVLAKNLANFADLVQLFVLLEDRTVGGTRLGAISNAGFECVAIADSIRTFELAEFSPQTRERLQSVLASARIESIVDVHNPLDLTPMSGDAVYGEAIEAIMEDDAVDIGVVGVVPLTPALQTLESGEGHREDLGREGGIVRRMADLRNQLGKPWVAVVDGGRRYDPFARALQAERIPTFRTADRAVKLFEAFVTERLRNR